MTTAGNSARVKINFEKERWTKRGRSLSRISTAAHSATLAVVRDLTSPVDQVLAIDSM